MNTKPIAGAAQSCLQEHWETGARGGGELMLTCDEGQAEGLIYSAIQIYWLPLMCRARIRHWEDKADSLWPSRFYSFLGR